MMKKIALFTILLAGAVLAACHKPAQETPAEGQTEAVQETAPKEETIVLEEEGFSFDQIANREFYFSSGAGAWYTVLYIHADGSFDGHYQDSDMGAAGEGYPNGTIYYSDFSGTFTEPEQIDETTYVFQIASIDYPCGFGEEYKDGFLYCYTDAYGLTGAEDLYLYLPGTKIADLPEQYRTWVGYYDLDSVSETELPFYGLYNVKQEEGFSSYEKEEEASSPQEEITEEPVQKEEYVLQMEAVILEAEEMSIALETELNAASAQSDMNKISGQIYEVWDDALNNVWGILKENLDKDAMAALTEEERAWIEEKEKAVKEAGKEYEGGSMLELVTNQEASRLTKERVYQLKERFS